VGKGSIENRIEQMKEVDKHFNASLRLGVVYDSRVGSASGGGNADGDYAGAATVNLGWQAPTRSKFGFRVDYSGYADFHQDFDQYDVIDQSISIESQYTFDQYIFSLPVSINYAMEDGDTDYDRYSISPTITYLIPNTNQALALYGMASKTDDRDKSVLDDDGNGIGAGCAYIYFFKNKSRVRLSLGYQQTEFDAVVNDYNTISTSLDEREDEVVIAGLDFQYQLLAYFGLYLNYSYLYSDSNVDIYDYGRHIVESGMALRY